MENIPLGWAAIVGEGGSWATLGKQGLADE